MDKNKKPDNLLQTIEQSVIIHDAGGIQKAIAKLPKNLDKVEQALNALSTGMERARTEFKRNACSIPELLLSIDTFRAGIQALQKHGPDFFQSLYDLDRPQIVIGVIEGDIHDMGKNIVAAVMEASGYSVIDAGRDVTKERFLEHLDKSRAPVLAISSMMSTPLDSVAELIVQAKRLSPAPRILVGGAPFDAILAKTLGADGYCENAAQVPEELVNLLGN